MNLLAKVKLLEDTRDEILNHLGLDLSTFYDWNIADYTKHQWADRNGSVIWADKLTPEVLNKQDYYAWEESSFLYSDFIIRKDGFAYVLVHARHHSDRMYDDSSFIAVLDLKNEVKI